MSKKILQFIVIFLAILIILCFVFLVYGIYLKFEVNQNDFVYENTEYSLDLKNNEKIKDIQALQDDKILIVISNSVNTSAIIYDTKKNKILTKIRD